MHIREAETEDLERMADLFGQLGYPSAPAQLAIQLHGLRASASGEAFVAEQGDTIVGVLIVHLIRPLHVEASWALLSALVVDDKCRNSGVGRHLLSRGEGYAKEHGCSQLELSSSSTRTGAHIFYERNGYQEKRLRFVKTLS
jgi:GNAT superfamily N-acetyltransferase